MVNEKRHKLALKLISLDKANIPNLELLKSESSLLKSRNSDTSLKLYNSQATLVLELFNAVDIKILSSSSLLSLKSSILFTFKNSNIDFDSYSVHSNLSSNLYSNYAENPFNSPSFYANLNTSILSHSWPNKKKWIGDFLIGFGMFLTNISFISSSLGIIIENHQVSNVLSNVSLIASVFFYRLQSHSHNATQNSLANSSLYNHNEIFDFSDIHISLRPFINQAAFLFYRDDYKSNISLLRIDKALEEFNLIYKKNSYLDDSWDFV
ncbi:hypothetical protein AYI69_g2224 [Smittium culicis]|uniref:Uncharacterized protein n=1 Tax=Smittium culicis TaxID=133412 RepID=A0A1R1YN08_9FUNG|nr:hypothetical protein AYI69_g2224 [Smittium culicis]